MAYFHTHPPQGYRSPSIEDLVTHYMAANLPTRMSFIVSDEGIYLLVRPKKTKTRPGGKPYSNIDFINAYNGAYKASNKKGLEREEEAMLAATSLVGVKVFKGTKQAGEKTLPQQLHLLR